MIPKILHQVWLGKNPIPNKFLEWREGWKHLHPEWDYMLWTDEKIVEIESIIKIPKQYSSKSNIVRLWCVLKYGGVYCDMDFQWNKNINHLLNNKAFCAKETPNVYCNAIFGSIPNNPWLEYQYELALKHLKKPAPWGPKVMTEACIKFPHSYTDLPTFTFYPYLWDLPFKDSSTFPDSLAVHHWEKSWR